MEVKTPFFVISPKSYIYGEELIKLAKIADKLSYEYNHTIFFSAPPTELKNIIDNTNNLVVTSQSADGNGLGRGMGRVLIESLNYLGVKATFLNHMEAQMNYNDLINSINKANELGILTIVCADSIEQAKSLAHLPIDIILCEQNSLIGTGKTSDDDYILQSIKEIRSINENVLVMEGAGISSGADVARYIKLGADGTGISSLVTKMDDQEAVLRELFEGLEV